MVAGQADEYDVVHDFCRGVFVVSCAIAELTAIVNYVESNPCSTQAALLTALAGEDKTKAAEIRAHLTWLIEKGYVVAYANGALTAPAEHPLYRQPKGATPAKDAAPAPTAEPAPAPTTEPAAAPVPQNDVADAPAVGVADVPSANDAAGDPPAAAAAPIAEEPKEEVKQDETAAQLAE